MIKCGIIGYGKMGRIRARTIEESNRGKIVAVWDANPVDSESYVFAESAEALINHPEIDAVFICTPNYQIAALCKAALRAGKHVFSEKPPAFNAQEVLEVIEVEKLSSKKLMYGFNHRHHESIKRAKTVVDSGEFGRLLWMRGRYGKSVDAAFLQSWRAKKELVGGGILLDQGIHMLDLFLHFAEDFDQVQAMVSNLYWKLEGIEDNVFAQFANTKTGVAASLHSTMTQWRHLFSLELFLERGNILLHGLKTSSGAYGDEILTLARNLDHPPVVKWGPDEQITYHTDTSWASELDHFFTSITNDTPIQLGNSGDALRIMRLIDRVYASSKAP